MFRSNFARLLLMLTLGASAAANASDTPGLSWPKNRLLPTFSAPAARLDCVDITSASGAEIDLFASLQGIVNRTQPRMACVNDKEAEGKYTWIDLHQMPHETMNGYDAVAKYQASVTGLVVTDPDQPATLNLATAIAGLHDELICDPSLLATLTNAPYHLSIKDDLRGRFSNSMDVYQCLYSNYWPQCTHRAIAGLSPHMHGALRDYLVALKAAPVWLAPGKTGEENTMLAKFISEMTPAHGVYLGWWKSESDGLGWIGQYGIPVLASDFFHNATVFGSALKSNNIPAIPTPPALENKIYVSIILSDGDNVQYMQHHMKIAWNDPARGTVPIGWTVSPLAMDIDPGMLDFYRRTASPNDCLVSGPSGAGYGRLNYWKKSEDLIEFAKVTEPYLERSGLRVITVWNKITDTAANAFAANCPSLLGLTDQSGGSYLTVHGGLPAMGLAARASYNRTVDGLLQSINKDAQNWHGSAPMFIAVQGDSWFFNPIDCQKLAAGLDKNKFVVVRPDHLFLLCRQAKGLAHDTALPGSANSN